MALGGILLSNYIFMMMLGSISMFIMTLTAYIILSILRKKKDLRIFRIFQVMTGIMMLTFIIPLLAVGVLLAQNKKKTIEYDGKVVKVDKITYEKFYRNISFCDTEELDSMLKKNPELIYSKTSDGLYPLGYAVKFKQGECIKYFVDNGSDINITSDTWGTLEYMFNYDYYDDKILDYVLSIESLDLNKQYKAIPVAQLYLKSITKDKVVTDKEADYFDKMIKKDLNLTLTNGSNKDTFTYINNLSDDIEGLNKIKKLIK